VKLLLVPVLLIATLFSGSLVQASPPSDFCLKHPSNPRCLTPTPTPTVTPTPVITPTPAPTTTPTPVPPTPTPAPTPTPGSTVTQTVVNGSTVSGTIDWEASVSVTSSTADFAVDNTVLWTEHYLPYQYGGDQGAGAFDTTTLTNGQHTFKVTAKDANGNSVGSDSDTVTVANAAPTPTPVPTPTPTGTPGPTPSPGDPWAVAFGTRPASGPITLTGSACQNITISNKTFENIVYPTKAIRLENCNGVVVDSVDFINVSEGVYAVNSSNITLKNARYSNITGPAHDAGGSRTTNAANLTQFNNVSGGLIQHNKGRCGDTEDIISVYSSDNITIEDNQLEGVFTDSGTPNTRNWCLAWKSNSGTGIIIGDGQGTGNIARNNVVVNPGQVGIAIAGGTNNTNTGNITISEQRAGSPSSNVGNYVINYSGGTCSGATVTNNRSKWLNGAGSSNPYYTNNSCGSVNFSGNTFPDNTLNIANYRVQL